MADLVDYLRDKLDHADDAACTCARVEVGWDDPPQTVRGRTNPNCPIHAPKIVRPGGLGYGHGRPWVDLWPDRWRCRECATMGEHDPANAAAWDHVATHLPLRRRHWWRR